MNKRRAMTAIFHVLRTGCQWKALPRTLGAPSAVYGRFREWAQAGVFSTIWQKGLCEYDLKKGLDWKWQSVDGCMTKAPLGGGERSAPIQPTARNPAPNAVCSPRALASHFKSVKLFIFCIPNKN